VCGLYRQWNRDDVRKRQWNDKDTKDDRLILLYERARQLHSLFRYRIWMTCVLFQIFFFRSQLFSNVYSSRYYYIERIYESYISYEGQVNRTQQGYNLLGQRVVCQYVYIYIDFESLYEVKYKLEWTMEKQRERERDKSGWINEKQIWWSWSFILLLSEAHSYSDKVIQMKKKK
jgi:hypothetical protein